MKHFAKNKKILFSGLIILAVGIVAFVLFIKKTDTVQQVNHGTVTANSATKGEPNPMTSDTATGSSSSTNAAQPGDEKSSTSGSASTTLEAPSGDFVSSHRVTMNGGAIQSVCNATPGATCQITFTKDGVTKSLAAQTGDRGGSSYWTWKPVDIGLTPGSWHITAKVKLGSQTKVTADALELEVSQ